MEKSCSILVFASDGKFPQLQVARRSAGTVGQRYFTNSYLWEVKREGVHVTHTHQTETVDNLSILITTNLAKYNLEYKVNLKLGT
jgi:hypothetical protein